MHSDSIDRIPMHQFTTDMFPSRLSTPACSGPCVSASLPPKADDDRQAASGSPTSLPSASTHPFSAPFRRKAPTYSSNNRGSTMAAASSPASCASPMPARSVVVVHEGDHSRAAATKTRVRDDVARRARRLSDSRDNPSYPHKRTHAHAHAQ